MCGLRPIGDLKEAQRQISRMASKAFVAATRRALKLRSTHEAGKKFGCMSLWYELAREGTPDLLRKRHKIVTVVARETKVPVEVLDWKLWRLLHPVPLSAYDLHTAMLSNSKAWKPDISLVIADPAAAITQCSLLPFADDNTAYQYLLRIVMFLREAEYSGCYEAYASGLRAWYSFSERLAGNSVFAPWSEDLRTYINTWFTRVLVLATGPKTSIVVRPVQLVGPSYLPRRTQRR